MADKEVLSQEEIDALLNTVDKEEPKAEEPVPADQATVIPTPENPETGSDTTVVVSQQQIKVLNFNNQERIVRGELPVLDKIHDRAARYFANDIYSLMAKELQIKQEALQIVKHREFLGSLPNPSLMTIYRFKPLRGKALIVFDSIFVYDLVNFYFGGSAQFLAQTERTDFTAAELRVMDIVINKLVNNIVYAWSPIIQLDAIRNNDETNPQLVHIAEPNELLLVYRYILDFGKEQGSFFFVIPYSMVEPIKQQLELGAARPDDEIDPNWVKSLKEELMDVELTISSAMAQTENMLGTVMNWQAGDFLPLEKKDIVTLDIEGTPSFTASMGTSNDKRAVKVIKKIDY